VPLIENEQRFKNAVKNNKTLSVRRFELYRSDGI
jgi:hypothetical protein